MHEREQRSIAAVLGHITRIVFLVVALVCLGSTATRAVEETRLLQAHTDHDNWLTYGHGYANQRYSGLEQITTDNV